MGGRVHPAPTGCDAQAQTFWALNTINTTSLHSQTEAPDFSNSYLHNYQVVFSPFLPTPYFSEPCKAALTGASHSSKLTILLLEV